MKKNVLWVGLLILALVLSGCGKPKVKVQYATFCGWIIDAADELPLEGATVKIDGKVMASTDGSGWFQTGRFQTGVREIEFSAESYNSERTRVDFPSGDWWLVTDEYEPGHVPLAPIIKEGTIQPKAVYDLPVVNGTGEVTIDTQQKKVGSLLLIPYNTSMTSGTSFAELTVGQDGIETQKYLLNSMPLTMSMAASGENETEAFYERMREKEREAIQAQLGQGDAFGVSRDILFGTQASDPPEHEIFYKVIDGDYGVEVEATLKYKSAYSYIYIDNEYLKDIPDGTIKELGETFDKYYGKLEEAFAPPEELNIDEYTGIFYLLTKLKNYTDGSYVAGYFWGGNELPKADYPAYMKYSNEKEILFLTTYRYGEADWLESTKSTMAHELQHLINFTHRYMKINSYDQLYQYETETWINEGLSMVAEDLVMDWNNSLLDERRVVPYLKNPAANSLCTWGVNDVADYPPAYMFMRYFVDRFSSGPTSIIQDLLNSNQFGLDSVVSASREGSFIPLFRDWLTAVYISCQELDVKTALTEYDYYIKDLSLISEPLAIEPFSNEIRIPDTTGQFIELGDFGSTEEIRIAIDGSFKFKLRVLMFPPEGEPSFSTLQFQLQKVR